MMKTKRRFSAVNNGAEVMKLAAITELFIPLVSLLSISVVVPRFVLVVTISSLSQRCGSTSPLFPRLASLISFHLVIYTCCQSERIGNPHVIRCFDRISLQKSLSLFIVALSVATHLSSSHPVPSFHPKMLPFVPRLNQCLFCPPIPCKQPPFSTFPSCPHYIRRELGCHV